MEFYEGAIDLENAWKKGLTPDPTLTVSDEYHKTWMLEKGRWQATAESDGRTRGYHLSSLYSPVGWFSWADAAHMFEAAQQNPDLMKGFINTVLGEPYEEEFDAPEWERLYERREAYPMRVVPQGGLFITAGVDVQRDRNKGFPKATWEKDPTRNNEVLDCRVYARAAASIYGLDRFKDIHWKRLEQALGVQEKPDRVTTPSPPAQPVVEPDVKANTKPKALKPFTQRAAIVADDPYL